MTICCSSVVVSAGKAAEAGSSGEAEVGSAVSGRPSDCTELIYSAPDPLRNVTRIQGSSVYIGEEELEISRTRKKAFMDALHEYHMTTTGV